MRFMFLFIIAVLFLSTPAEAALPGKASRDEFSIPTVKPLLATYDVYVGGMYFITADILFEEAKRDYHAQVQARTRGFWHKMFPWSISLDTHGKIQKDSFIPVEYNTKDVWDTRVKLMKMRFKKNGKIIPEFNPPSHDDRREDVTADQRRDSLDPITALLQMLAHVAINHNCNIVAPVFDGKRRFDVIGRDNGSEYIDGEDYGIFKGEARRCSARFDSIAGAWKDPVKERFWKNAEGEDREPFHIWLGPISPNLPEMPVRVETGSIWGVIMVHLAKWRYATPDDVVKW